MSKFHYNSVDRRDLVSIRSGQMMKKNLTTEPFFKPFNQPRCHGNGTHLTQNARINPYVVKFDSCKNWAPKHK